MCQRCDVAKFTIVIQDRQQDGRHGVQVDATPGFGAVYAACERDPAARTQAALCILGIADALRKLGATNLGIPEKVGKIIRPDFR